jgi:hypothetical protein
VIVSWSIAVLTNAAGNASPANAAHTDVVVLPSGAGGSGTGHSATATTPTIHVTETLRGRELMVRVSGPASGTVRVGRIGRLRGRTAISRAAMFGACGAIAVPTHSVMWATRLAACAPVDHV